MKRLLTLLLILPLWIGCTGRGDSTSPLVGTWRAVLESPGGELPFALRVRESNGGLLATVVNGEEEAPMSSVHHEGNRVVLATDWYDSEITATLSEDGGTMIGQWRKTGPGGTDSVLPFRAHRGQTHRFGDEPTHAGAEPPGFTSVQGSWSARFQDEDGTEPAVGEFEQQGTRVTGTFLTPTGDYRFLEGDFRRGVLRLSAFDGAHAFLFRAVAKPDGTLAGDFWSRDGYHATWSAQRLEDAAVGSVLPDPFDQAHVTNEDRRFRFALRDLEGRLVSSSDERFDGKVVLVNLFGSWCPNCNDEAPLLATWDRTYRDQGLEIVGLAFEMTGDAERDRKLVRRYAERHDLEFPLLLAGTSDKQEAAATLPDLDRVVAYPTSIFIGRDGTVRHIHSGFAGPGTGEHHERLVAQLTEVLESLLAEEA